MNGEVDSAHWESFDSVYLINLPERTDRKRELRRELSGVGLDPDSARVVWMSAERPLDAGEFPSVGARGCFLSHLVCLKDAMVRGHRRVLIIEDDASFPISRHRALGGALDFVKQARWDVWYGGGSMSVDPGNLHGDEVSPLDPAIGVQTSHFVALQGDAVKSIRAFFDLILTRPAGHPEAGPMHVDGAYSTWRALNTDAVTLICIPPVCLQRSSRSDIAQLKWFDEMPILRKVIAALRRLRNNFPA